MPPFADIAVANQCRPDFKTGSLSRTESRGQYNQLLRIEQFLERTPFTAENSE